MKRKRCDYVFSAFLGGFEEALADIIDRYFDDEQGEANKEIHHIISHYLLLVQSRTPSIRRQKEDADNLRAAIIDLLDRIHPMLDIPPYVRDGLKAGYEPLTEYDGKDDPMEELKFLWKRLYHLHQQIGTIAAPEQLSTNPGKKERDQMVLALLDVLESNTEESTMSDSINFLVEVTSVFDISLPNDVARLVSRLKK